MSNHYINVRNSLINIFKAHAPDRLGWFEQFDIERFLFFRHYAIIIQATKRLGHIPTNEDIERLISFQGYAPNEYPFYAKMNLMKGGKVYRRKTDLELQREERWAAECIEYREANYISLSDAYPDPFMPEEQLSEEECKELWDAGVVANWERSHD